MAEPMDLKSFFAETEKKMTAAIEAMKRDFGSVRTGKASPAMLDSIMVDYYGSQTRLKDIASITAPEVRMLVVQPWDQSAVKAIEKAIIASDLGISPVSDGRVIRLPVPELSEERRKELAKGIRERAEKTRVAVRDIRRGANDALKKAEKESAITEDESKKGVESIQKLTDKYVDEVNKQTELKEKELMAI